MRVEVPIDGRTLWLCALPEGEEVVEVVAVMPHAGLVRTTCGLRLVDEVAYHPGEGLWGRLIQP